MDNKLLASIALMSAMSLHQISSETILDIVSGLSFLQLFILLIRGSVLIDWIKLVGWREKLPFYLMKCEKHGFQLSYPQGYHMTLSCSKCASERSL